MFTGLVEDIGTVVGIKKTENGMTLEVKSEKICSDIKIDDSVSIDGCCQTIVSFNDDVFKVNVVKSTLEKTKLGNLNVGSRLNLELALKVGSRIGGHIVQGHINTIGKIKKINQIDNFFRICIDYNAKKYSSYLIDEGSISVNGVSLTISNVVDNISSFELYVIPHTWQNTTMKYLNIGDSVNLEFDIFAQYVNRVLSNNMSKKENQSSLVNFLKGI